MKKIVEKHLIVPSLLVMAAIVVSCVPAAGTGAPALPLPAASNAAASSTPTATQTQTSTFTASPTITPTVEPSLTQPFVLLPGVLPARTRTRNPAKTPTATRTLTATLTPTAVETRSASLTATCLPGTPEPLWVEPVTSPTDQLSQTIVVRIGNGEEVTVETESGTFTVTGNFTAYSYPARVDITLLPDTIHHLRVTARVATIPQGSCLYGGYTLSTTTDAQGDPLTIVQASSYP
jgi:hypothetical protein